MPLKDKLLLPEVIYISSRGRRKRVKFLKRHALEKKTVRTFQVDFESLVLVNPNISYNNPIKSTKRKMKKKKKKLVLKK